VFLSFIKPILGKWCCTFRLRFQFCHFLHIFFEIWQIFTFFLEIIQGFSRIFWVCAPYLTRFLRDRTSPTKISEIGQSLCPINFRTTLSDLSRVGGDVRSQKKRGNSQENALLPQKKWKIGENSRSEKGKTQQNPAEILVRLLWRAAGLGWSPSAWRTPNYHLPSWWGYPFNKHSLPIWMAVSFIVSLSWLIIIFPSWYCLVINYLSLSRCHSKNEFSYHKRKMRQRERRRERRSLKTIGCRDWEAARGWANPSGCLHLLCALSKDSNHVQHVSFICDITYQYVPGVIYMWQDSFVCDIIVFPSWWLSCDTLSLSLIHMRDMAHLWQLINTPRFKKYVTGRIHDVTHSYVTWLIHM